MPITGHEFVSQAQEHLYKIRQASEELEQAYQTHQQRLGELQRALALALDELTQLNLPTLEPSVIQQVQQHTGYRQFEVKDPLSRIKEEEQSLPQQIAQIEAEPRYQQREALLHPVTGEFTLKIATICKEYDLMRAETERYETQTSFNELYANGYGTDDYTHSFLSLQYYEDWKHGDEIVEHFGKENFQEVRADYARLRAAREEYKRDLDNWEQQRTDLQQLIQQHDDAVARRQNLPARILQESQAALREHLKFVDREQLFTWSQGDRGREALVKKIDGLEKKLHYLEQMTAHQTAAEREQLNAHIAKLQRKVAKYERPKNQYLWISDEERDALLADPRVRINSRRERFWRDYDRVYEFDRYNAYDYRRDLLWWDLMTDGRVDGNFIEEVREYREAPHTSEWSDDYQNAGARYVQAQETTSDFADYS